MATRWSVILNRIDHTLQVAWKEWRGQVVTSSTGVADAGAIPMLGPDGLLDPSMIPGSSPFTPQVITLTAGMDVNAFQAISIHTDGLAYLADASTLSDAGHVVGVSVTSASTGNTFTAQQIGEVDNVGFLFTPGSPIFLGFSGALVEILTVGSVFQQPIGVSISSSRLLVEVGLPIILS